MVDLRRSIVVLGTALGITGCLFPSFDDLSGGKGGAADPGTQQPETRTAPDPGASDAATEASSTSSNDTGGSSGGASTPDASAPKQLFACDKTSCEFGKQMCCTKTIDPWVCKPIGPRPNECGAVPQCTDNSDCKGAGELCCYNDDTRISQCAKTSCTATNERVLCNPQKNGCKNNGMCTGNWWGMSYCI